MIEPITRKEMIMSGIDLEPITRKELFLAKAAGMDVETPEPITREEMFLSRIKGDSSSGGSSSGGSSSGNVSEKDVNFYDYDGTLLHSYTVAEAQALTELPELPEREGLICQGWNYDLETIKEYNRAVNVGATYTTDDGTTRIYIHLVEGGTSPMLSLQVNGTVTVDWGDGTTPDTLTGTRVEENSNLYESTPNHEYAEPGDYVIKLTVDGEMAFIGTTTGSRIFRYEYNGTEINGPYRNAIKKIEIGSGVTSIWRYAFNLLYSLESINIPADVTYIGQNAFGKCYSLKYVTIPSGVTSVSEKLFSECRTITTVAIPASVTTIERYAFNYCHSLTSIVIPNGVTSVRDYTFYYCYALKTIVIPDSVTSIGNYVFNNCNCLDHIVIPDSVTSIGNDVFTYCNTLAFVVIPERVTSLGSGVFQNCASLVFAKIPKGVSTIKTSTFRDLFSIRYIDFTKHTVVPAMENTNAFNGIAKYCEIRVPAALYDEWIAATNWATYADKIVAV